MNTNVYPEFDIMKYSANYVLPNISQSTKDTSEWKDEVSYEYGLCNCGKSHQKIPPGLHSVVNDSSSQGFTEFVAQEVRSQCAIFAKGTSARRDEVSRFSGKTAYAKQTESRTKPDEPGRFDKLTLEHPDKITTSQDYRNHTRNFDELRGNASAKDVANSQFSPKVPLAGETKSRMKTQSILDSVNPSYSYGFASRVLPNPTSGDIRHSGGYCNNCGKYGHSFHQCKMPITSYGLIVFRRKHIVDGRNTESEHKEPSTHCASEFEYLMIRRRDTLGFIDFMRGKYSVYNKKYILNMVVQMTDIEKMRLLTQPFHEIWTELWGNETMLNQYRVEEESSREKLASLRSGITLKDDFYTLEDLIIHSRSEPSWEFAEWGFPKGRRNYQEKDYECAVREFCEETGYAESSLIPIQNILPFEEIFTGSNYKSYKHKYYLTYMPYEDSLRDFAVQSCEVSCAEWKTMDDCLSSIRHYNAEKRRVLENVHRTITEYVFT